ncbi:MarR family transcriptional regulator [Kibdelosporangium lantanae]
MELPEGATLAPAGELAAAMEGITRTTRRLSPSTGLSMTAVGTLATLERSGPRRLTELATGEAVSQPAMTQLISRLADAGLVRRATDSTDRRVVQVDITDAGRAALTHRREVRAERIGALLDMLAPEHRAALLAAIPAMNALTSLVPEVEL